MLIKRGKVSFKVSLIMVMVLLFTNTSFVSAVKIKNDVISEKEVEEEWKKADEIPVESDKGSSISLEGFGKYPRRKGVILVTKDKYKGLIPTGHAAIVYSQTQVVESLSKGVTVGKNNWDKSKNTCYGVTVKGTSTRQDAVAANWCYLQYQYRRPYNFNYTDVKTREKFYCSQLVYAAFLDYYGIDLNTPAFGVAIHPMELVNTNKTTKIYQK